MKKLLSTKLVLLLFVVSLVSCGNKDVRPNNTSGTTTISNVGGDIGVGTGSQSYSDIQALRSAFNSMSLGTGLSEGTYIYHLGSYFGGSNSSVNFEFSITGCFFGIWGDCSNTHNINSQLQNMIDKGEVLKVEEVVSNEEVNLLKAVGVENNDFTYDGYVYTRDDSTYQEMLALESAPFESKVTQATIYLRGSNQAIPAVIVEHIYGNPYFVSNIKRFIVSTNLPVAANPIAVVEGVNPQLTGVLKSLGNNVEISRIDIPQMTGLNNWGQIGIINNQSIYVQ